MLIKFSDFILENSISESSSRDIELERCDAELRVNMVLMEMFVKEYNMKLYSENVVAAPPQPNPTQTVIAGSVTPGKEGSDPVNKIPKSLNGIVTDVSNTLNELNNSAGDVMLSSATSYVNNQITGTGWGKILKLIIDNIKRIFEDILAALQAIGLIKKKNPNAENDENTKGIIKVISKKTKCTIGSIKYFLSALLAIFSIIKFGKDINTEYKNAIKQINSNKVKSIELMNVPSSINQQHDDETGSIEDLFSFLQSAEVSNLRSKFSEAESQLQSLSVNNINPNISNEIQKSLTPYYDMMLKNCRKVKADINGLVHKLQIQKSSTSYSNPTAMTQNKAVQFGTVRT